MWRGATPACSTLLIQMIKLSRLGLALHIMTSDLLELKSGTDAANGETQHQLSEINFGSNQHLQTWEELDYEESNPSRLFCFRIHWEFRKIRQKHFPQEAKTYKHP